MTTRLYTLGELEAMDREETGFDPASLIETALHYARCSPPDLEEAELPDAQEEMSVRAIMRHNDMPRDLALTLYRALKEAERAFNSAKKANESKVMISRASLWRMIVLAGVALGMNPTKAKGGPR